MVLRDAVVSIGWQRLGTLYLPTQVQNCTALFSLFQPFSTEPALKGMKPCSNARSLLNRQGASVVCRLW